MGVVYLYLQYKISSVSVVLDFNASLNDVAPVSLILFTVYFYENEKRVDCPLIAFVVPLVLTP